MALGKSRVRVKIWQERGDGVWVGGSRLIEALIERIDLCFVEGHARELDGRAKLLLNVPLEDRAVLGSRVRLIYHEHDEVARA